MKTISDKRVVILTVLLVLVVLFGLGERSFVVAKYAESTDNAVTLTAQITQTRREVQDLRQEVKDQRTELTDARKELGDSRIELTNARKELGDGRLEIQKIYASR